MNYARIVHKVREQIIKFLGELHLDLLLTDLRDINIIGHSLERTKFTKRSNDEKPHS